MKRLLLMVLVLSFLLPVSVRAERITFVTGANSPPHTYMENGNIVGLNIDIVREACKRIGSDFFIRRESWKRALRSMEQGDADGIIAPTYTEERSRFLDYPSESLGDSIKVIVIIPKGSGIRITGLDDLKGRSVGVVLGYAYGPEFDNYQGLRKEYCTDEEQMFRIFDRGRMDVAITREAPFRFLTKKLGLQDRFEITLVLSDDPLYVAFSKARSPESASLAKKFARVLREMKDEGVVQKFIDKYR